MYHADVLGGEMEASALKSPTNLIEELESRGLDQYIITKKVLDRSMLVKDRKMLERLGIKGLSYTKGERFYIKINKQVVPEQSTIEPTEVALSPS